MKYLSTITLATSLIVAQNIDLGEVVVVSATKSEQKLKDVTSNVVVITKEDLEAKHITTVAEALREAQGVIVTQAGGLGGPASVYLRGFDSDSTVVLVDGVRINNPTLIGGQADIGNLIINDIDRIEIIKGPQSGVYGANAVAGVINIITSKANKKCSSNINFEYGSYNTKKSQVSFGKKFGNLSAKISYSYLKSGGFSAQADIKKDLDSYEDDSYENKNLNAKASYDFSQNDKLDLEYMQIDSVIDYDKSLFEQEGFTLTKNTKLYNIAFTHKYSNNSYSKIYFNRANFTTKDPLGWIPVFEGSNKQYGIDNKITFENLDILFGLDRVESKDKVNNKTLKSKGVYITANYKYNNTIVSATLRRDFYSEFKDETTGKIGIKHTFDNGLAVSANYGKAYRVPSLFEYSLNPNLEPETTKSYDIGFEFKNFTFTYFNNKIDDEILYDMNLWSYYNSSKGAKIKGYEIGYKGSISDTLLFSLNYTRFSAKDKDGYQLLRRPKFIANLDLDYYGFEKTHINFNAQYIGKREDLDFSTIPAKKVNTGNKFIANASIDYQISKNASLYLKINNIFDKKYQDVAGYATSGRAFYVGINAKF